jgi:hypothetical protein
MADKKLCDFCWVCLRDGKETPSVGKKYGYPFCNDHNNDDLDPEAMEKFVINLFK